VGRIVPRGVVLPQRNLANSHSVCRPFAEANLGIFFPLSERAKRAKKVEKASGAHIILGKFRHIFPTF